MMRDVGFKTYCWSLGTTSFRVAQLSRRTEEYLMRLHEFIGEETTTTGKWQWNSDTQIRFYNYLHDAGSLTGEARRKDKDAREKTSGFVSLGYVNDNREITDAGQEFLAALRSQSVPGEDTLYLHPDSYVHFKQLLKTSIRIDKNCVVRPYIVIVYLLTRFGYLTTSEYTYLAPLVIDEESFNKVIAHIEQLRKGKETLQEAIADIVLTRSNYKVAYDNWNNAETVTDQLIMSIGMNRKSKNYDRNYYPVYQSLTRVFVQGLHAPSDIYELFTSIKNIKQDRAWRGLLFNNRVTETLIKRHGYECIKESNPFNRVKTQGELKQVFFKTLHVTKIKSTLEDYADLNERYLKLSDTFIFDADKLTLDAIPAAYFSLVNDRLKHLLFISDKHLNDSVALEEISPEFRIESKHILTQLTATHGRKFTDFSQVGVFLETQRYNRLHKLLDERFTRSVLEKLLDDFTNRNDSEITQTITDNADIPTLFEYILGLTWYELSERKGKILDYMNLTLEADLMPRTHATGGEADIVYQYEAVPGKHDAHTLLIEATLSQDKNERRMEMEPVSRHLGEHELAHGNTARNDYCVFAAPTLNVNVINDFRGRKIIGYYNDDGTQSTPLKIIPLEIQELKQLLVNNTPYTTLYKQFDEAYASDEMHPIRWRQELKNTLGIH